MRLTLAVLLAAAAPGAITVTLESGDVVLHPAAGPARALTSGGKYSEPRLSPDRGAVAFIHQDTGSGDDNTQGTTSLWVAGTAPGAVPRRLLAPHANGEPKRNLASFNNPHWSLDARYVYIDAEAWATSSAIHQVNAATGQERFVVDGWSYGVLRDGPYRGYLLVGQHRYHPAPGFGSYNPVSLVRPDGKAVMQIPGSARDDGENSVPAWLKAKGWTAS